MGDVHFHGDSEPMFPKTVEMLPKLFDLVRSLSDDIDLLIINGDLVSMGSSDISEVELFKKVIEGTGVPYKLTAGNHDIAPSKELAKLFPDILAWEDCPLEETNFGKIFPQSIRNVHEFGPWQLVFFSIRDTDQDGQLPWLKKVLSAKRPTLLFGHYPVVPQRTDGYAKIWGFDWMKSVGHELRGLIENNDDHVLAYFCGHHHINSRMKIGKTEQIATGGATFSTCCYKYLDIKENTVRVTTHVLPGVSDWLSDATDPDDSHDQAHPTVESYHWGNEDERNFSMEYNGVYWSNCLRVMR